MNVVVAIAASLLGAMDGSPDGPLRLAAPAAASEGGASRVAAPAGSALTLTPRLGIASCGYCGLLVGGSATARTGPWIGGAFIEGAAIPAMDSWPGPEATEASPATNESSVLLGVLAGTVRDVRGAVRLGLAAEGGAHGFRTVAFWKQQMGPTEYRTIWGWSAFVGARATVAYPIGDAGTLGVAAFVRQPLWAPCMDVGRGCERPSIMVGGAFELSIDVRRRG